MTFTPNDILLITLSVCLGLFTLFLCWTMFYIVQLLRESLLLVRETRAKIDEFFEFIDMLKDKVTSSVSYLGMLSEGVTQILKFVGANGFAKTASKKKSSRVTEDEEEE